MRVSTSQVYANRQRLANMRLAEYVEAQQQVASGKRIDQLSDDAPGAMKLLRTKSLSRAVTQYDANLRAGKDYLQNSEVAFSEMSKLLDRAYTLAVAGANESQDQNSRTAMAQEVRSLQEQFVRLANQRGSNGQYIFAGQKGDAQPYSAAGGTLTFVGDNNPIQVEIAHGEVMRVNSLSDSAFQKAFSDLESLRINLETSNQSAISGITIPALQNASKEINALRATTGTGMNTVTRQQEFNARRLEEFAKDASDIEDVDVADAISRLQQAEVAYQAALTVSAKSFQLSLLDYM